MVNIKKFIIVLIALFNFSAFAQDPHFSQPSVGNVNLNSALAGNDSIGRIGIVYRNQWPNLSGNYITTSVNGYQYISKLNAYAGINFMNDNQANTLSSNNFSLFYGQNINLKNVLIRPAMEIGYGNKKLDWTKLNFGDQIDYRRGFVWMPSPIDYSSIKPKQYLDINVGLVTYYKNFTLGLSLHHLNRPNIGLLSPSYLPKRFGLQLGYQLNLNKISISPYFILQEQQNFNMLITGINTLLFKHVNLGFAYRNNDAVIGTLGFQNRFMRITYSFDNTISKLSNYNTRGSHEISTIFNFWKTTPKKRLIKIYSIFS